MKQCIICGKTFVPRNCNQKCCSKECSKKYYKTYYTTHREEIIAKVRKYQAKNPEKVQKWEEEYKIKHQKTYDKTCLICNKEFTTTKSKITTCSPECDKKYKRQQAQEYLNNKYKNDTLFRIKVLCRNHLKRCYNQAKQNKDTKTFNLLGYTPQDFKKHIESHFYNDMTWENFGKTWEIHHIKPLHTFDFIKNGKIDHEQIKIANSLDNLQPLTKEDHHKIHHTTTCHLSPN